MSNDPILLTKVDLRLADEPGTTRILIMDKLLIPPIKFVTAATKGGGAVMGVNWLQSRTEAVEPKASIKGLDLDAYGLLGDRKKYSFAQAFKNKRTTEAFGARGIIEGTLAELEQDESSTDDFGGCNFVFQEVTHFEYVVDGKERWYIDFFENVIRRNGVELFADERRALGA